jgi:hypothetical protein
MEGSHRQEAVSVRTIKVYTTASCPVENVHREHNQQTRRTGVCRSVLLIGSKGSYADL